MKKQILILTTALLSLSTLAQIPTYVPTNGLVGYWPFNGNANDESGNGNNGTVNGATLTADRFGIANKAYSFNGLNNNIVLNSINSTNSTNSTNDLSFSYWVRSSISNSGVVLVQNNITNSSQTALSSFFGANNNNPFSLITVGHSGGNCSSSGNMGTVNTSSSNYLNQWYNITGIIENNGITTLFINGTLIQSSNIGLSYSVCNIGTSLRIAGPWWNNDGVYFNGFIDDIGIWNRALTACEIQDLYASQLNSSFVSAGIDESICNGEQVTLTASGSQNYSWNNGVVHGAPFSPTNTLNYIVTADSAGCQSADTLTVFVNQPTNSTLNETALDSFTLNGQTYTQSGTYIQVIPNAAGCDSTITLNLSLDFTGFQELESSFTISPNPTTDELTITTNSLLNENYILFDPQGRKVLSGSLTGTTTELDLSKLASGNYLLQVGEKQLPVRIVKN
jgi:hypothetical protein